MFAQRKIFFLKQRKTRKTRKKNRTSAPGGGDVRGNCCLVTNLIRLAADDNYHDAISLAAEADFVAVGLRGGGAQGTAGGIDDAVGCAGRGGNVDGLVV